jgi:hypothetical protein
MASRNLYLTYKKDTSRLLWWVINSSNLIIMTGTVSKKDSMVSINTTGQCTMAEIVTMSRFIAKHQNPVTLTIIRLLQGVIRARFKIHEAFKEIESEFPDPDIEKSNATHKRFIEALTEAFEALGGASQDFGDGSSGTEEAEDEISLRNRFSVLNLGTAKEEDNDASGADDVQQTFAETQNTSDGKVKIGKRAKKSKQNPTAEPILARDICRIIGDKDLLDSEYLLAVYAVVQEWQELRFYTQELWRQVAYKGLNGAVAASLTSTAVAMVKQTCIAVFADFPDRDHYDTIIRTILPDHKSYDAIIRTMQDDPEKAQEHFSLKLYRFADDGHHPEQAYDQKLDTKEQFRVHAYNDLVAFITDF